MGNKCFLWFRLLGHLKVRGSLPQLCQSSGPIFSCSTCKSWGTRTKSSIQVIIKAVKAKWAKNTLQGKYLSLQHAFPISDASVGSPPPPLLPQFTKLRGWILQEAKGQSKLVAISSQLNSQENFKHELNTNVLLSEELSHGPEVLIRRMMHVNLREGLPGLDIWEPLRWASLMSSGPCLYPQQTEDMPYLHDLPHPQA